MPSASVRLIQASTVSVPWECCSAPRAVSTMTLPAPASSAASSRSSRDRHAGDPLDPLGPPRRDRAAYVVEAGGARRDVLLVDRAGGVEQVQQAEREREVGARDGLQDEVGALGGGRAPRVDHDDLAAALAEPVEVPRGRRHGLGEVGADQHQHVGLLDVGQRERQPAVEAEGAVAAAAAEDMHQRPL